MKLCCSFKEIQNSTNESDYNNPSNESDELDLSFKLIKIDDDESENANIDLSTVNKKVFFFICIKMKWYTSLKRRFAFVQNHYGENYSQNRTKKHIEMSKRTGKHEGYKIKKAELAKKPNEMNNICHLN